MRKFLLNYLLPRIGQYIMVIFLGVTLTFLIPRISPNDPVTTKVNQIMMGGANFTPAMINDLRTTLTEMYGLEGSNWEQYLSFWKRLFKGDLGPSLSAFPTPVMDLVTQALPWTMGLLLTAVLISWVVGNLLGGLASYYPNNRLMQGIDVLSQGVRPIPYYIMALVLLILFGFVFPILPYRGAYPLGSKPEMTLAFAFTVIRHSILPAFSLVIGGIGAWFIGMKSLTSNIISEDYVVYAETAGLKENKILFGYIIRNAMLPQVTGLALQLGMIFNGALIMEVVFTYPGLGLLMFRAVMASDYSLLMGITLFSIVGVATIVFILDIIYPLFDPRVRYQ